MKVAVKHENIESLTDSSLECDQKTAFVLTSQNKSYLNDVKAKNSDKILTPHECFSILGIDKNIKIVGITGTNGKTTTAAAIYSMLLDLGQKCALQGTRGFFVNEKQIKPHSLTTPSILETLSNLALASKEKCNYFIMEVSSHAIAQDRIESLDFALKIFTNLSQDHLDFHKSMEEYKNVKSRFFSDESLKLINSDEEKIYYNRINSYRYGVENKGEFLVKAYSLKDGISAVFSLLDSEYLINSALHGDFNLYNLLAAASAVKLLANPSVSKLEKTISNFGGVSGRVEVVSKNPLVIVDFAHTPDGMKKVLNSLKHSELIVLFGAGGDRDKTKRPLMGSVASRYAKRVILTSDNPRSEDPEKIIEDILQGVTKSLDKVIKDRKEAIIYALNSLQEGEVLLILGKGDEEYQEIKGEKYPFSDRKIVKEWLKETKDKKYGKIDTK